MAIKRMIMNKKGEGRIQATMLLFVYIFVVFFGSMFLGLAIFFFAQVDAALDQDIDVGQVNLREINADTFGAMTDSFLRTADTIGLFIVLGMIGGVMLVAFFFGNDQKIWIPIDFIIILFAFITSVYLSQVYDLLINSTAFLDVYINNIPQTSRFMLNLPLIVSIVGAILMVLTYSGLRKDQQKEVELFGR
ncbi:hypothetical protein LCGC14_1357790 [marine sediment metagenome]|uniref:Uncharacterized protein n=1 Tax=marine sediment metagenome TaxID=412755 RepID=A0A0F9KV44_9ZZZZ